MAVTRRWSRTAVDEQPTRDLWQPSANVFDPKRAGGPMKSLLLLPLIAGFAACNPTVSFDVPVEADATIEGASLIESLAGDFGFGGFAQVDLSDTQEFENRDVRKEQVTSAKATLIEVTVKSPDDQDFDFIEKLAFEVEAAEAAKETVAQKTFPKDARTVDLDVEDLELAPYVRSDSFKITTAATASRPRNDTTVHVKLNFNVTATVFAPGE
jgi:hypothetical protein